MNILPNSHFTDVLNQKQLKWLAERLPEPSGHTKPAYPNIVLLPGILKLLRSGCRWRDLDASGIPAGITHWRRFRLWERKSWLWRLCRQLLSRLYHQGKVDLSLAAIDGTLVSSFSFRQQTGYSGKHHRTGTKIVAGTDKQGLPLSLAIAAGNRHDQPLALPALQRLKVGQRTRPEVILGDKGFDSAGFRRRLRKRGIKSNIPQRRFNRRRKRGRPPKYDPELGKQRFVVERTNGWLKSFRRLRFRYDYTSASFRGLVLLAFLVVCIRRLTIYRHPL